jgi:hypothetical protein
MGDPVMKQAAPRIAFTFALATLALVVMSEGAGPAYAGEASACVASPPADLLATQQQQAATAQSGSGAGQSGPEGRGSPSAGGEPPPAAGSAPQAVITIAGRDRSATPQVSGTLPAEFPKACAAPSAAARSKAHKTRSNIQNN